MYRCTVKPATRHDVGTTVSTKVYARKRPCDTLNGRICVPDGPKNDTLNSRICVPDGPDDTLNGRICVPKKPCDTHLDIYGNDLLCTKHLDIYGNDVYA